MRPPSGGTPVHHKGVLILKLSMWMIANQLAELDVKQHIREDAPAILNSARLAYATNCVHIYQEGDHVVCDGEGDQIIFDDMEITRVFELIQSIFDAHEDWISSVKKAADQQDYPTAIDTAHKMFKNPMVLFDANNKVLAMTRAYGEHELDSEWEYLHRYGYSSINAINMIKFSSNSSEFYSPDKVSYLPPQNNFVTLGGISTCIYFNNVMCGRINLIAKERRLNQGDVQLLESLVDILQHSMGLSLLKNISQNVNSVFLNLMLDRPYDRIKLDMQLRYQGWKPDDTFYVSIIRFLDAGDEQNINHQVNSMVRLLVQNLTDVNVNVWENDVILLSTRNLAKSSDAATILRTLAVHNPVQLGFSLPNISGIEQLSKFYRQAEYTLNQPSCASRQRYFKYFRNYAPEFLLTSQADPIDKMMACMPEVLQLWYEKFQGSESFQTLHSFLSHERSISQTSAELFLHRNTTVYRIKKIQENLHIHLDDDRIRYYCCLSMSFLNACDLQGIQLPIREKKTE